ncbi:MAG: exodeoxyribonuclease VII small subunit [Acidobacteria bacterium ACB1]|nr:Exodeoxyribonuclease 7 small subunit [Pyrinomonadaceae bacterium]MCE7961813.1 exodeoxyribonuclease VII small subunit [Acidobacteria bacterium ACB1]RIJ92951.1 MAG: exodeoxyribonuclease VII small subunit [Acidobacteriota bacterium]
MKELSFEDSLSALEKIVAKLEDGELKLDESLALFEKGIALSRTCRERLDAAERRIEILSRSADGELYTKDLDADSLRN